MAAINKNDLARAVAEATGLDNGQTKQVIDATVERITAELGSGNEVNLPGFGKFSVSERAARDGRNPQTGETMRIAATRVPRFAAASALKTAVKS
jgi:nucleoid DNA-binding protein